MEAMKPQISLGGPPRKAVGGNQQTLTDWPSYASVAAAATTAASVTTTVAMAPTAASPSAAAPAASLPPGPARAQRVAEEVHSYLDALAACCAAGSRAAASFGRALDGTPLGEAAVGFAEAQEVVRSTAGALAALVRAEVSEIARGLGPTAPGDGAERGRQDIQVMGSCLSMLVRLQCSVLSQGVKTLLPVARALGHELAGDLLAPDAGRTPPDPDTEQRDALQTWRQAVQATAALRGRAPDGTLVGREVQKLFCCQGNHVADAQLRELNSQVDHALQAYMQALERLHQSEFSMKAGFHRSPAHTEEVLQDCCIEAEAQQAGMSRLSEALVALELPTVSLHIGSAHLKGVPSSSLTTADNLAAKMQAMRAFLKEALGVTTAPRSSSQRDGAGDAGGTGGTVKIVPGSELGSNGVGVPAAAATLTGANGAPVAGGAGHKTLAAEEELGRETLGHVCPSVWRGACKTAVQLLFGQAGLVVVDTAEVENREAYTPQISQEGDKIVVQVPSTWCVKEDPATMSLLRRWLDPERSVALVDVLYTATLEPARWRAGRAQALPCIQLLLRREAADSPSMAELPECTAASAKPSGGFQKTFSRLTSRLTKKHAASVTFQGAAKSGPSRHDEDKKATRAFVPPSAVGGAGSWKATSGPLAKLASSGSPARGGTGGGATGAAAAVAGSSVKRGTGLNLPSDQEMQEVIDFLSGVGLSKSQQPSPMNQRRTPDPGAPFPPRYTGGGGGGSGGGAGGAGGGFPPPMLGALGPTTLFKGSPHGPGSGAAALPPPLTPQQQQQQAAQAVQVAQAAQAAAGIWSAWELHGRLGPGPGEGTAKTAHVRNNTWPNRFQPDGLCGVPETFLSLDPAVKGDPEYARYVTGLAQVLQHQQQQKSSQHQHGPGHRAAPSSQAQPALGEAVAAGEWQSAPAAREIGEAARAWQCKDSFMPKVAAPGAGWLGLGGRPAQHGEEPLPANGHACFSMFSGPDLVAAVSQRRRHSSGEQQVAAVLSMPRAPPDTVSQEKTKTWPLKSPWMAASTLVPTSTAPYPDAGPPVPWYEDSAAPAVFPPSVWSTEACDGTAAVASAEFTPYIPHQLGAGAATQRLGAPGYGQGPGGERRVYTRPY